MHKGINAISNVTIGFKNGQSVAEVIAQLRDVQEIRRQLGVAIAIGIGKHHDGFSRDVIYGGPHQ